MSPTAIATCGPERQPDSLRAHRRPGSPRAPAAQGGEEALAAAQADRAAAPIHLRPHRAPLAEAGDPPAERRQGAVRNSDERDVAEVEGEHLSAVAKQMA